MRRAGLDLGAVDRRDQVDGDVVAGLDRPLDAVERAEPLAQRVQLLVDVVVGDGHVVDGDRDPVELRQGDLGPDVDLGGEASCFPSSRLVTSMSGWPRARTPCSRAASA